MCGTKWFRTTTSQPITVPSRTSPDGSSALIHHCGHSGDHAPRIARPPPLRLHGGLPARAADRGRASARSAGSLPDRLRGAALAGGPSAGKDRVLARILPPLGYWERFRKRYEENRLRAPLDPVEDARSIGVIWNHDGGAGQPSPTGRRPTAAGGGSPGAIP